MRNELMNWPAVAVGVNAFLPVFSDRLPSLAWALFAIPGGLILGFAVAWATAAVVARGANRKLSNCIALAFTVAVMAAIWSASLEPAAAISLR